MKSEEKVVAVISPQATEGEEVLAKQVSEIEFLADSMIITNDEEYEYAADLGVILREKIVEVNDFFAPMKKTAHEAHKRICEREKEMLSPLKNAENILKKTVGDYVTKKEEVRKAKEETAKKLVQEEIDQKLSIAAEAEANGDTKTANSAMLDAQIADSAARSICVTSSTPKANGVSVKKDYEITNIDESKVPTSICGVTIRPVDKSAVMKLIRSTKGKINIEGITYKEKKSVSFSRRYNYE